MTHGFDTLTREESFYANLMLQNQILGANGQRYEDLFVSVMTRRDVGFQPVKPQGSIGDEGNDGYVADDGRYYQVYSPEDPGANVATAAKKATDDFAKLKLKWNAEVPIIEFRFVFNDKYSGAYPEIEHALNALKTEHALDVSKTFLAKDLEREFMALSPSEMQAVLRSVIPHSQHIEDIEHDALTGILQHLVNNQTPLPDDALPSVPEFDAKIAFNGLNKADALLNYGNFQNAAVDEYFNRHGEFRKSDIRNRIAQSYENSKSVVDSEHSVTDSSNGDRTFFHLLNAISPNSVRQVQEAAIVLVAYFFEKCDVFEDPNA